MIEGYFSICIRAVASALLLNAAYLAVATVGTQPRIVYKSLRDCAGSAVDRLAQPYSTGLKSRL